MLESLVQYLPPKKIPHLENRNLWSSKHPETSSLKLKIISNDILSFGNKKYPERIDETPGFSQMNEKFVNNGATYCAP